MKRKLLFASLLLGLTATAQDYEWQWAKRGGGLKGTANETATVYANDSEQIFDIAVDADNNYYYLAFMGVMLTEFDGQPITSYNSTVQTGASVDVVLISTDCEGNFRWSQTIGGGYDDYAYKIELDNNGGLYIGAEVVNLNSGPEYLPPHFSEEDALGVLTDEDISGGPNADFKTIALLKYNTDDGSLAWRVMPQGPVDYADRWANIRQIQVDSEAAIHALIGFDNGTHLNGALTVAGAQYKKYYVVKYDTDGNYLSHIDLHLDGDLIGPYSDFRYDEELQRYYIAGFRTNGGPNEIYPLYLNGTSFQDQAYIISYNNQGNVLWYKESASVSQFKDFRIYDIEVDSESNIYLAGKYFMDSNNLGVNFGGHAFPNDLGGNTIFIMKLNPAGAVQWLRVPTSYNTPDGDFTGTNFAYDLTLKGDEVIVGGQSSSEIWGELSLGIGFGYKPDPSILHLNKETGEPVAFESIAVSATSGEAITAIAVDNDNNFVVGGYFYSQLFGAEDDNVPTLTKVDGNPNYTDFFIAKFANAVCGSGGGTVGIDEVKEHMFSVYPNPASGMVNIQTQEELSSYEVVNMLGQVLLKGSFAQEQNQIAIESLSAGTYIINVKTMGNTSISRKIIKQ